MAESGVEKELRMSLVLTASEVMQVLDMDLALAATREAFRAYGEGRVNMPPKAYLTLAQGDFRAMYGEIFLPEVLLAARAIGLVDNPDACAREWNPIGETVAPDPAAARFYKDRRVLFEDAYRALAPVFPRLRIP